MVINHNLRITDVYRGGWADPTSRFNMIVTLVVLVKYGLSLWRCLFLEEEPEPAQSRPSPFRFELPRVEAKAVVDPDNEDIRFYPLVSVQRYETVKEILKKKLHYGGINKVVDLGCSAIKFFPYIRNLEGVREYIAVDIDEDVLVDSKRRVEPLNVDFLKRRPFPFNVKVLLGSASDPDLHLKDTNVIIAIELIEHLYPDVLEALPYNIFGVIQPEIAIFTTPNSDFNVFFPNLNATKFRHYDHKFEWSREQFRDWAENLTVRYPNYEFDICGVGPGPAGSEDKFGCCTQLVTFFRRTLFIEKSNEFKEFYRIIRNVDYPYTTEEELKEEMVSSEVRTFLWNAGDCYLNKDKLEIPISSILNHIVGKVQCDEEFLRFTLIREGYDVETLNDGSDVVVLLHHPSSSESIDLDNDVNIVEYQSAACVEEEDWNKTYTNDIMEEGYESVSKNGSTPPISRDFSPVNKCPGTSSSDVQTRHEDSIHRCKSCDQIVGRSKNKNFRFSLNMEKNDGFDCARGACSSDKIASSGSISDTIGSHSKAPDSGYPNSINMDMDLTPEQVEEITTESESSFEGNESGDEEVRHDNVVAAAHLFDDVENGDVANNNRDGEGNNMEDNRQVGEPLEFQQLIQEDLAQANLAAAEEHDSEEESFISSSRDAHLITECISTTATIGSEILASSYSLAGIPSISRSSPSQEVNNLRDEFSFPDWLLNINVIEEADRGRGDAPEQEDDDLEFDDNLDLDDIDSELSNEMIVRGDFLGGGDISDL
ncbi:uncharacterized protein LOC106666382 [Cimex lectularius]|uniref:Small RNA 2'-O-methyltransferase n=1 Tax=Cimex lectularius TaxID=79782 RepID=A0A8I6RP93_CIMLE|nr:uncharacterized protein LOC106666382 [Cimex lectularius]